MTVMNSMVLYLSLLSMMTYGSYKMNYSKYVTKTANEKHTGLEKIIKSLSGVNGRFLLRFHDKEGANPIKFPEPLTDNREGMAEFLKTTTGNDVISVYDATSNINEDSDEQWRLHDVAISDSPITSSSPRSFRNNFSPRMYSSRQVLPPWISWLSKNGPASRSSTDGRVSRLSKKRPVSRSSTEGRVSRLPKNRQALRLSTEKQVSRLSKNGPASRSSTDGRISWLFKNGPASRSSTDGRVSRLYKNGPASRSSTDGRVSRLFKNGPASRSSTEERVSSFYGGNTPILSPTRKREDTTPRKNIWTINTVLFKHTTKHYFLVFDKNGNMRSNVTIHRSF